MTYDLGTNSFCIFC